MMEQSEATTWIRVVVPVTPATEDIISSFLFDLGSVGCQQFENRLAAYFPANISAHFIQTEIKTYLNSLYSGEASATAAEIEIETIPDQDWNATWKRGFKPLILSNKLVIKPSWEPAPVLPDAVIIEVDPEQAFGTGHHETTRMALLFLEENLKPGDDVLDVGTGTGILAIAAAKFGANRVVAFDIDPVAVRTARDNCRRNGTLENLVLFIGELDALKREGAGFDLIVANINKTIISRFLPDLVSLLNPAGKLFLTGLLLEDEPQMRSEISLLSGVSLSNIQRMESWLALTLTKVAET